MTRIVLALILAAVPALANAQLWRGFCGNYEQLYSNAGDCPTCTLLIADSPETGMYFVEANNGWSAEAAMMRDDGSLAAGVGRWGSVGGIWDGANFGIMLSK